MTRPKTRVHSLIQLFLSYTDKIDKGKSTRFILQTIGVIAVFFLGGYLLQDTSSNNGVFGSTLIAAGMIFLVWKIG